MLSGKKNHQILLRLTLQMQLIFMKNGRYNRLSMTFIKTNISAGIRGYIDQHDNVKDSLKAIDEQFTTFDKSLTNTLIMQFSSMRLTGIQGVHYHIMRIREILAQMKALEITMSDSFLVHYILCTLPH